VVKGGNIPPGDHFNIGEQGIDFEAHMAELERRYLTEAMAVAGGVRTRAAELLGMSYRSFRHYAQKHGI
jgi:two-component system, NtrC family, response regulator PilR